MADESWQKVREIFDSALCQKSEERRKFVHEACGADKTLLMEVESLLSSHDSAESFMETPAVAKVADVIEAETDKLEKGQSLGHYEIIKQIGAGGMGEVYLAKDKKLDRQVAVKILNEKFSPDESNLQRFISEAKAASALNHPNILTIYEFGESGDAHYIVSEFIEGLTLREIIRESKSGLAEILDISIQIAGALSAAHKAHLVHRDIKPENIMIRPDGYVKILDFGLAKLIQPKQALAGLETKTVKQNETAKGVIMGTVNYMSPEQAKGERIDERTDIFSFGAVIYEMIAGRTPFAGDSVSDTFANLINQEPPPIARLASDIPAELQRVVLKMLRKDKTERFQTMKELSADLKDLHENLRLQGRLNKSPVSETENRTEKLAVSTGEARKITADELAVQTAKIELVPATSKVKNKHNNYSYSLAGLISVVVLLIFAVSLNSWLMRGKSLETKVPVLFAPFSSEKLSTNGKVVHAVVSPDGKNVVYTNGITGKQSIWLRQLESANNIQIIPPSDDVYGGLAFSPDGDFLYFNRRPRNAERGLDIYRVSIFGGIPTKIANEAQGWMSVSPDGGKISFVRCNYFQGESCSLWIAETNGTNERRLVSRQHPIRIGDNKFSPDGKTVAFAVGQSENGSNEFGLAEVNIESGAERELTAQKFFNIRTLAWLPNQNGLLIAALRMPDKNFRLWQVSIQSGDASPLTKDSENYSDLSLDKAGGVIVATQTKEDFNLTLYNRENPSDKRVLADAATVGFAPNGKILYSSPTHNEIWSINADGSGQMQLTNDAAYNSSPVSSPDGNSIFFVSNRTGKVQVWRMNTDGSNQTQITDKEGGMPIFVSPDGHWIYYHHGLQRTLWRVLTKGGDTEQLVLNKPKYRFAFSPDGSRVAFSERHTGETYLVIVSLADERIIKTFKYPDKFAYYGEGLELGWLPDGKNLVFVLADSELDNNSLWLQPIDTETPQKIADLGDEEINSLAASPNGESFAIVQGGWKHDAVLLKGLK